MSVGFLTIALKVGLHFPLLFTTFEASIVFSGSCGRSGYWLELKTKPP